MKCREALTRVDALRTGELPAHDAERVHEHLGRCRSCGESLDDVERLARSVRSLAVRPAASLTVHDSYDTLDIDGLTVTVAFSPRGIRMIRTGTAIEAFRRMYADRFGRDVEPGRLPDDLRDQVAAAVRGEGVSKPEVDLTGGEFERRVLQVLTRIPKGEVRTYAWVAGQAGNPKAVRAVGNICAKNVVPFVVPCHRVVPSTGGVGNYAFGTAMKDSLLRREGVPVDELERLARAGVRFIGSRTTHIFCVPTCRDAQRIHDENRVELHDAAEAVKKGFRPCKRCQPAAA